MNKLIKNQSKQWAKDKKRLASGRNAYWDYIAIVVEIVESKTYLEEYKSQTDFLEAETNLSASYFRDCRKSLAARQNLLEAPTDAIATAETDAPKPPEKESHLREIAKAPKKHQAEVAKRAAAKAAAQNRAATAKDFAESRKEVANEEKLAAHEEKSDEAIEDACKRLVPYSLLEQASAKATIMASSSKLNAISKEIKQLANQAGGEFVEATEIAEAIKSIKKDLVDAAYWTHCPRCKGNRPNCELCEGFGFMPKRHKGYLTIAEKRRLNQ